MKLLLHFIDDNSIIPIAIDTAISSSPLAQQLRNSGIETCLGSIIRVGNTYVEPEPAIQAYHDAIAAASLNNDDWNIIFADLRLCDYGLSHDEQRRIFNQEVPESLRIAEDAPQTAESAAIGGFAIAWKAALSKGPKNLIVFASSAAVERRIDARFTNILTAARAIQNNVSLKHHIQGDSFSIADAHLQAQYIEGALRKWIAYFWSPRERLQPSGSEHWFIDRPDQKIPHNYPISPNVPYENNLISYLAGCLQMDVLAVSEAYSALENKCGLHKYLKSIVGGCAAAHLQKGERMLWGHLPLLARACVPPPGEWIFDKSFVWDSDKIFNDPNSPEDDSELLTLLVGDKECNRKGLFTVLFSDKINPEKSTLKKVAVNGAKCTFEVNFDVTQLANNFNNGQDPRPTNDCSGAIWDVHNFLSERGCQIVITPPYCVTIQRKAHQ